MVAWIDLSSNKSLWKDIIRGNTKDEINVAKNSSPWPKDKGLFSKRNMNLNILPHQ